ncbi:MAG: MG2 domain-containing protein [Candidatus Zixiibacteriota bacterium]
MNNLFFSRMRPAAYILPLCLIVFLAIGIAIETLADAPQSSPDPNVKVVSLTPQGQTDPRSNITVVFSRDMVSRDSLNRAVTEHPLLIDPPLNGTARWIEQNTLRFYPDNQLSGATEYTIKVKSNRTFLYGNRINEDRTFSLFTRPLTINYVSGYPVKDPENKGAVRLRITLSFNYDVNLRSIKELVTVKRGRDAVRNSLSFEIEDYASSLISTPSDSLRVWFAHEVTLLTEPFPLSDKQQEYQITIQSGLPCYKCGTNLGTEANRHVYVDPIRRLFVQSAQGYSATGSSNITISLSTDCDIDDFKKNLTVYPDFPYTIEERYNRFILRGPFNPGEYYDVTIAKGLPSTEGSALEQEFSSRVKIPDLEPVITFKSQGIFLPRQGNHLIGLESVNIEKVAFDVQRVFANNLVYALGGNFDQTSQYYTQNLNDLGGSIFDTIIELPGTLNEPLASTIDIGSVIDDSARGIYKIYARNYSNSWTVDSRLIMITDIGIMAREASDYLMVWANTLNDVKPINKAIVSVFSRNNQLLATEKTDSRGIAIFDDYKTKIQGFDPYLITVESDDDLAYLKLYDPPLPTSEFDIKGRPFLTDGYEAFLYSDRGVYRPGDTLHVVSVVRGADATTPPQFPYVITIKDPTGREYTSFRKTTENDAVASIDFPIPDFAATGTYRVYAGIGKNNIIGSMGFQVEEFMPERIKTTVSARKKEYTLSETVTALVAGKYLFGPPTAGHNASGTITIEPQTLSPTEFSSFTFSDYNREFSSTTTTFSEQVLDENGQATFTQKLPENIRPPSALKGLIGAGISEPGGRAVYDYTEITIHPYPRYLGLRLNLDGYAKPGQPVDYTIMAIDTDQKQTTATNVMIVFNRIAYNSVLQKSPNGIYRYVSKKTFIPIDSVYLDTLTDAKTLAFTPTEYGRYAITATDEKGGHAASVTFYASGWGYAPWSMEHPDRIDIALDKTEYEPGDKATVQIRAPFGGRLLVTIEKDKVYEFITNDMEGNTAELTIPIKGDFAPNAYITATIIKPAGEIDPKTPARAFGIAPIVLAKSQYEIPVMINAPDVIKPESRIEVGIELPPGQRCKVILTAVDAGILQLTDYQIPDPLGFFHGKRSPYLQPYDIYSFIYPNIDRAQSHLSFAGGLNLFEQSRKRHLNPISARRVKPVAIWSGILEVGESGRITAPLDIPQFSGQLVLTAVAIAGNRFDKSSKDMIVRDKIVVQESFPRFLTPGDSINGLITLFNNTGADADITVTLAANDKVTLNRDSVQNVTIPNNAQRSVRIPVRAAHNPGKVEFAITASTGSDTTVYKFELANRPAQPITTTSGFGSATASDPATFTLPEGLMAGTELTNIQTSSLAAVNYVKNLEYLLRYPYGCLEQTTSRLFPLLYFNDLARFADTNLVGQRGHEYYISEGILRLQSMYKDGGIFSFWPYSNRVNGWASVYAMHFIVEAKRAGYTINDNFYKNVISSLKDIARGKTTSPYIDIQERIYAAYALTKANIRENRILNYLRSFPMYDLQPYSRYQMAGIYAAYGDTEAAYALIPDTILPDTYEPETGGRFDSGVRTNAILLDVLQTIDPSHPGCAVLAMSLTDDARASRWYTTQATAWALMALGEYFHGQEMPDFTGTLSISGDSTYNVDTEKFSIIRTDLSGKTASLAITGKGTCFYYWQSGGVPTSNAPAEFSNGIKIMREYLASDGSPAYLGNLDLGDQLICHIKAEAVNKSLQNVVISDLLPSCFEIENPRLKSTPRLSWLPKSTGQFDFQDIRDDRLLLFTDLSPNRPVEFYYSVRVISAGEFVLPPVAAECMYNPMISAASSSGTITIQNEQ